jgi:hypothetical protein
MAGISFGSVKSTDAFAAGSMDGFTPVPKEIHGIRGWAEPDDLNEVR